MEITKNNTDKMVAALTVGLHEAVSEVTKDVYAESRSQLQRLIYDTPESPNYQRTHNLYNSARYDTDGLTGRVTVGGKFDVGYAVMVHEGTAQMPARPYLTEAAKVVQRSFYTQGPIAMDVAFRSVR